MKTLALVGTFRKTVTPNVGALPLKVILVRLMQPKKAERPMLVTPSGIVILVRLVQPEKVPTSMLVTPSGIVISLKLLQPLKACDPMMVTLSGISMLVMFEHSEKV